MVLKKNKGNVNHILKWYSVFWNVTFRYYCMYVDCTLITDDTYLGKIEVRISTVMKYSV